MSGSTAMDRPTQEQLRESSLGELLSAIGSDASLLVRQEVQLAKTEMTEKAVAAGVGVALLGVAAVLLLAGLGAGVAAAIAGLANVFPTWLAALIVLGGFVVIAALVGLVGISRLKKASPPIPDRAITTAKETPGELIH